MPWTPPAAPWCPQSSPLSVHTSADQCGSHLHPAPIHSVELVLQGTVHHQHACSVEMTGRYDNNNNNNNNYNNNNHCIFRVPFQVKHAQLS